MCVNPYIATRADGSPVPVPCGHCLDCRKQYQNEWTFRLTQEAKRSVCPCFVTLTFNDEHLPLAPDEETGEMLSYVSKRDVQLFMKRLRKNGGALLKDCRYYAVGEYGSRFNRCHYHLVIISPAIATASQLKPIVDKSWCDAKGESLGFTRVTYASHKQFQYVTKYMNKLDERFHLVPPFRLMSRSIGLNFLSQKMVDYYLSTFDRFCRNGKCSMGLPRYYKKKLDEASQAVYGLKKAGLVYSDLLEDIKPVEGTKYFYLRDFTENYEQYFMLGIHDLARHYCDAARMTENQLRQVAWYAYVSAHKQLQDIILNDTRLLNDCKIRNKLLGREPVAYNLPASVVLAEAG